MYFADLHAKMAVNGALPLHYFDESDKMLNSTGVERAVYCWGHEIAGMYDIWWMFWFGRFGRFVVLIKMFENGGSRLLK